MSLDSVTENRIYLIKVQRLWAVCYIITLQINLLEKVALKNTVIYGNDYFPNTLLAVLHSLACYLCNHLEECPIQFYMKFQFLLGSGMLFRYLNKQLCCNMKHELVALDLSYIRNPGIVEKNIMHVLKIYGNLLVLNNLKIKIKV